MSNIAVVINVGGRLSDYTSGSWYWLDEVVRVVVLLDNVEVVLAIVDKAE